MMLEYIVTVGWIYKQVVVIVLLDIAEFLCGRAKTDCFSQEQQLSNHSLAKVCRALVYAFQFW